MRTFGIRKNSTPILKRRRHPLSTFRFYSLFLRFSGARLAEALGEGVVVNLELGDLLVLVGRHADEGSLLEDVRPERGVWQLQDVVCPDQVEPRLVLVHRVQDSLEGGIRILQDTFLSVFGGQRCSLVS